MDDSVAAATIQTVLGPLAPPPKMTDRPDYTKMDDDQIKVFCNTKFSGDSVQVPACIQGAIKVRTESRKELRLAPMAPSPTLPAPPPYYAPQPVSAPAPTPLSNIVGYSGFCEEGSVCATPVYGRPVWFWILLVIVILLASAAFKKS